MASELILRPHEAAAREEAVRLFGDIAGEPGNYGKMLIEVQTQVGAALMADNRQVPEVAADGYGSYGVVRALDATTSAVHVAQPLQGGRPQVFKVLRVPAKLSPEVLQSGKLWDEERGHFLFPWSGPKGNNLIFGLLLQRACLLAEARVLTHYGRENNNPLVGLVGARDRGDGVIETFPMSSASVKNRIWPALQMNLVPTEFNLGDMLLQHYQSGELPRLSESDFEIMFTQSILGYYERAIPASDLLRQEYGSLDFFYRCMVEETPWLTAQIGNWERADEAMKEAGALAEETRQMIGLFLLERDSDFMRRLAQRVVIGHADTKGFNILLNYQSLDELRGAINDRHLECVYIDPQTLITNPGTMKEPGTFGKVVSRTMQLAHWSIVPREQQLAYLLIQLRGMGLDSLADTVKSNVLTYTGEGKSWTTLDHCLFEMFIAYKMMVETVVNTPRWLAGIENGSNANDPVMQLVMRRYPIEARAIAERALRISRTNVL